MAKHLIDQFRYLTIQPKTIDLDTRLWGINAEFVLYIRQSLVLSCAVLGWILMYRNWSIVAMKTWFCHSDSFNVSNFRTNRFSFSSEMMRYSLKFSTMNWGFCHIPYLKCTAAPPPPPPLIWRKKRRNDRRKKRQQGK